MGKTNKPTKEQEVIIAVKLYLENVKTYASSLNGIAGKLHENLKKIPYKYEGEERDRKLIYSDLEEVQSASAELLSISTKLYNDEVEGAEFVRCGEKLVSIKDRCEKLAKKLNLPIKTIEEAGGGL